MLVTYITNITGTCFHYAKIINQPSFSNFLGQSYDNLRSLCGMDIQKASDSFSAKWWFLLHGYW